MLLTSRKASEETLHQLPVVGYMTSVYDLRHILSLGFRGLNQAEMHSVLLEAFEQVTRAKLVFEYFSRWGCKSTDAKASSLRLNLLSGT